MFPRALSGALAAVTALQLVARTSAADSVHSLDIRNAVVAPDGFPRMAVTAGGSIPGPIISANTEDRLIINVTDNLYDPTMHRATAIHWHGIFHNADHTMSMDGAAGATQCPILPGHSFTYNFTCSGQRGTFWYHAHLSTQYCDGLSGPLIIYDPEDPLKHLYDVDDESTVIFLQDWNHTPAPLHRTGPPADPDATLINGHGRWNASPTADLAVIRGQVGKRHRFRLINGGCFPSYKFSIEGHNLTVIETDGIEVEPVTVDKLEIFAGQRYSVIVTMDKPVDNYWIRAIPSNPVNSTTKDGINSAILRYDDAPEEDPRDHEASEEKKTDKGKRNNEKEDCVFLKETDLHPLIDPGAPGEPHPGGADVVLDLVPSVSANGLWQINNVTFTPPSSPVLLQILSGVKKAEDMLPPGSVYGLPKNAVVEITVPIISNHPFHLHGHTFDVVRTAGSDEWNFKNPVRRDVLSPGAQNDIVTIRFKADNPGPWFFHCHIEWHFEHGLAVVFAEDVEEIADKAIVNPEWSDLCPLFDQLNPDKHFELLL